MQKHDRAVLHLGHHVLHDRVDAAVGLLVRDAGIVFVLPVAGVHVPADHGVGALANALGRDPSADGTHQLDLIPRDLRKDRLARALQLLLVALVRADVVVVVGIVCVSVNADLTALLHGVGDGVAARDAVAHDEEGGGKIILGQLVHKGLGALHVVLRSVVKGEGHALFGRIVGSPHHGDIRVPLGLGILGHRNAVDAAAQHGQKQGSKAQKRQCAKKRTGRSRAASRHGSLLSAKDVAYPHYTAKGNLCQGKPFPKTEKRRFSSPFPAPFPLALDNPRLL